MPTKTEPLNCDEDGAPGRTRQVTTRDPRHESAFLRKDGARITIDLPPDYDAFKAEAISDQGDDNQGVYEVWWHANSWYPDLPLSTRLAIAESVVSDLLREGRITLVRGEWIGPDHAREAVVDVDAALRDWATWVPQPDKPVVWMADS